MVFRDLPRYDSLPVLIVGAGPAGCAAALALRRRGRPVLLMDRARFPRDKVCGDVLLPEAVEILADLAGATPPDEGARCLGLSYTGPSGRAFAGGFADRAGARRSWRTVRRKVFDAWLLDRAREAGADVREGVSVVDLRRDAAGAVCGVRIRDERGRESEMPGAAVIGADGATSAVARAAATPSGGLPASPAPNRLAVAVRGYAEGPDLPVDMAEVHATASTLPGCAWLVPVGGGLCNVGAGIVLADARRRGVEPRELLDRACAESPELARRLRTAELTGVRGWSLPLAGSRRLLAGAGWLVAGDAAGLIDPLTGHGIHTALASGRLAGERLAEALEAGDLSEQALRGYQREVRRRWVRPVLWKYGLQRMQARPAFADLIGFAGAHSVVMRGFLTRLAGHVHAGAAVPGGLGSGFRRNDEVRGRHGEVRGRNDDVRIRSEGKMEVEP